MKTSSKIWLAIAGILLIALGIWCLCEPAGALFATAWVIGCATLAAGISKLIFTFRTQKFLPNSGSRMLSALLLIVLGVIFLCNNLFVAVSLPFLFVAWIMAEGIVLTIESFDYKKYGFQYWWVILILGIAGIVLGFLGFRSPDASAVTLATLIGIGIILIGVSYLVALAGVNRFEKAVNNTVDEIKKAITPPEEQ